MAAKPLEHVERGGKWLIRLRRACAADRRCAAERTGCRPAADGPRRAADEPRTRILRLDGDLRSAERLRAAQQDCLGGLPGSRRLVLDLREVREADTRLIALVVLLVRRARAAGVPVQVLASPGVADWIGLCRLKGYLDA